MFQSTARENTMTSSICLCTLSVDKESDDGDHENPPCCPACVRQTLRPHFERHDQAMKDREDAKFECSRYLDGASNYNRLGALQAESQLLRDRLSLLRKQCGEMAVRVAAQAVENDSQRESTQRLLSINGIDQPRYHLERLERSLLQGSMHHALDIASQQVRTLRFQWARKAIAMHRLDIDMNDIKTSPDEHRKKKVSFTQRRARGIGKIGGLPLPHAGPELYGVLPPKELQSALRLVASVTCTLARCLGIVLPHPILLTPSMGVVGSDITDTVSDSDLKKIRLRESHHTTLWVDDRTSLSSNIATSKPSISPSIVSSFNSGSTSIMSYMDSSYWKRSAKRALAIATGSKASTSKGFLSSQSSASIEASPMVNSVQLPARIQHATAAILAEDGSLSSSKFSLSAEVTHQEDFAIALQLLQNNIIALCIRSGVPVGRLWPAEAILLNIYQLDLYCQEQTSMSY